MLKLLDEKDINKISTLCKNKVLGTRIKCYALSYGFNTSFVDFWASDKAVISRFEDVFTLVASADADFSEMNEFLDVVGCVNLVTDCDSAKELGISDFELKKAYIYAAENDCCSLVSDINDDEMREAYSLISSSIPGSFSSEREAYLSFLSDFKFRQNRGFARGKCIKNDGLIVATSVTAAETSDSAIISGVACKADSRGTGYGRLIVTSLVDELKKEGKDVYVIALNEAAEGFYTHIGFNEIEKIAYIKRCYNV